MNIKQTLTRAFQIAVALLIGALAMTVYIQHRELVLLREVYLNFLNRLA